jgi:hypothetical protein
VATFGGDFSSSFPVRLSESRKGKRFSFTLGNGNARLELEAFQGRIQLKRPDAALQRARDRHKHDRDSEPDPSVEIDVDVDTDHEDDDEKR